MAKLVHSLIFETDLLHDALADIERVFRALGRCHGTQFRALERKIETLAVSAPKMHYLGEGRHVVEPPSEIKAIISEARALGVI